MINRKLVACVVVACLLPATGHAHHGVDFILAQTAHLPAQGAGYLVGRVDYVAKNENEAEFQPEVLYGATEWMSLDLHAHIAKPQGQSASYEALAPEVTVRLTPRASALSAAVSAEYEIARDGNADDVFGLAGIVGYATEEWLATVNLVYEKPSGSTREWSFAAGVRRNLSHDHGLGLEFTGPLESGGNTEALLGYYGGLSERLTFNAGLGTGIAGGPDWSLRTTLIWQFR